MNSKPCLRQEVRFVRANFFLYQAIQPVLRAESAQARVLETRNFAFCKKNLPIMQAAQFLQVPQRSFFKRLVLSTTLWQHAKMSTNLKTLEGLKDFECKKGQLSSWPPVPCVLPADLIRSSTMSLTTLILCRFILKYLI